MALFLKTCPAPGCALLLAAAAPTIAARLAIELNATSAIAMIVLIVGSNSMPASLNPRFACLRFDLDPDRRLLSLIASWLIASISLAGSQIEQ